MKNLLFSFLLVLSSMSFGSEREIVHVDNFTVQGIKISTNNAVEMTAEGKIPILWSTFYGQHYGQSLQGEPVYGVYSDYESDLNGQYSLLAGVKAGEKNSAYTETHIESGNYMVFRAQGEAGEAAIAAWQDVWAYFANDKVGYQRAYTTDFEVYGLDSIAIYIAID